MGINGSAHNPAQLNSADASCRLKHSPASASLFATRHRPRLSCPASDAMLWPVSRTLLLWGSDLTSATVCSSIKDVLPSVSEKAAMLCRAQSCLFLCLFPREPRGRICTEQTSTWSALQHLPLRVTAQLPQRKRLLASLCLPNLCAALLPNKDGIADTHQESGRTSSAKDKRDKPEDGFIQSTTAEDKKNPFDFHFPYPTDSLGLHSHPSMG